MESLGYQRSSSLAFVKRSQREVGWDEIRLLICLFEESLLLGAQLSDTQMDGTMSFFFSIISFVRQKSACRQNLLRTVIKHGRRVYQVGEAMEEI